MADASAAQTELRGIGGWLIFPALWTIVGPLLSAYGVFQGVDALMTHAHSQSAMWTYVVIGETLAALAMAIGLIIALVLLFKYKRSYPAMFTSLLVAAFFIAVADAIVVSNVLGQEVDSSMKRDIGRSFLAMAIWGAYMHESKRVKNTFVH